jgi:hypothetical protein
VHDAGKNFTATEFKQLASSMLIEVKEVSVKAYNSVGLIERYHALLRRAYEILKAELKDEHIDKEMILQMAVKAVNNSAGPDGIVLTLLVFGSYPRMTEMDPPSPTIARRAEAIRAATKEVRRLYAKRQVNDALAMRNGPNTMAAVDLPLQSDVRVWRENKGWKGPYKLLATNGETCTIDMQHGLTNFRSTVVKPYYAEEGQVRPVEEPVEGPVNELVNEPVNVQRRNQGRPLGSRNQPRPAATRQSARQHAANLQDIDDQFISAV